MGESPHRLPLRVGVNAVVVEDGELLVVTYDDESGRHHNLPGGGVEPGEAIAGALVREVAEETTARVEVGDLLAVIEYHPPAHRGAYGPVHKLELCFACEIESGGRASLPDEPDRAQVGVEWIPVDRLGSAPLLPDLGERWGSVVRGDGVRFFDAW